MTAAKRLLTRAIQQYGSRFIDVVTTDALYMNPPFCQHCCDGNCAVVAGVKNDKTHLYKEIQALGELTQPQKDDDPKEGVAYTIYEIPQIHLSIGWDIPLRGFKIIATTAKETQTFLGATTLIDTDADLIRRIVHKKWGIENNGNKELTDNWPREHNVHHHPVATWAVVLIMLLAYNLCYAYVMRHLKTYRIYQLTQKQSLDEFIFSDLSRNYHLPWSPTTLIPKPSNTD